MWVTEGNIDCLRSWRERPAEQFDHAFTTFRNQPYRIHVPYQRLNELVNKRRGMPPQHGTALRLAQAFGNPPSFWMNLQLRWDPFRIQETETADLRRIRPVRVTG